MDVDEDYEVAVSTRGDVSTEERSYAEEKLRRIAKLAPGRVLHAGDQPYVFFLEVDTGRGKVVYRRYDGHYGVIAPAAWRAPKGG